MSETNTDDDLFGPTNLFPTRTGLPMTVWAGPRGSARHAPRIKVNMVHGNRMDMTNSAVVGILPTPHLIAGSLSARDRDAVLYWVTLNTAALLEHWDGAIDGGEMAQRTRRVP